MFVAGLVPDASEVETPFSKISLLEMMFVRLRASSGSVGLMLGLLIQFEHSQIRKQRYKYGISTEFKIT